MSIKEAAVENFQKIYVERNDKPNELAIRVGGTPFGMYSVFDPNRKDLL